MAVRVGVTILGDTSPGFNVRTAVGPKAPNWPGDVMIVQAFLRFIFQGFHGGSMTGMRSAKEVPQINGRMDAVTLAAIRTFQKRWAHNLIRTDGVVDPAQYRGRDIKTSGKGPLMTITLLHQLAQTAAATKFGEDDYTEVMLKLFPNLRWQALEADQP